MSPDVQRIDFVRSSIEGFLALTDPARTRAPESEVLLAAALDRLSWAVREIPGGLSSNFASKDWPIAVDRSDRQKIAEIFPDLGHYELADPAERGMGDYDLIVRDAIDDILDIQKDLAEVVHTWDGFGQDEALWLMRFSFEFHWEYHLRGLQLYLFHRLSPLCEISR